MKGQRSDAGDVVEVDLQKTESVGGEMLRYEAFDRGSELELARVC